MTASEREHTALVALSPTGASNLGVTLPKICAFALSKWPHIKARQELRTRQNDGKFDLSIR